LPLTPAARIVWDPINEREIVLLTNLQEFGATTTAIYKDRWEIELFFKALGTRGIWLGFGPSKPGLSAIATVGQSNTVGGAVR
jgi:hypothetical protein